MKLKNLKNNFILHFDALSLLLFPSHFQSLFIFFIFLSKLLSMKPLVILGLYGPTLDGGIGPERWDRWRPTLSLLRQEDLSVARVELLLEDKHRRAVKALLDDMRHASPETAVNCHAVDFTGDPWDFAKVYAALHGFAKTYPFDPEKEDYLVHITTGTHVAQICLFLLTESRHLPARLVQTSPPPRGDEQGSGKYQLIDLDLARYDALAARFAQEQAEGASFLKDGINTLNADFNAVIDEIERVAIVSREPILLSGPTGAGKSRLAERIFELKKKRNQVKGRFVAVNCATLRGDAAMSALFGHKKGAFTGAMADRPGLLKEADGGVLFLDEIGELGLDEQAMLLKAIEEKRFLPVGSDREAQSDFMLISGTNRDLRLSVEEGRFREDLLARICLWSWRLPGLAERREDIAPNLDFELERATGTLGKKAAFNKEGRETFLAFALDPHTPWRGNFRDLSACITRLATLAPASGRIGAELVAREAGRLRTGWGDAQQPGERGRSRSRAQAAEEALAPILTAAELEAMDRFDRAGLAEAVAACRESRTLSEAGRKLFHASREKKSSSNDADRLRKYLAKFGLDFEKVKG